MANIVKHKLVSAVVDLGIAGEASPSDWNDEHNFAGGSNGQFLVRDSTQSDGAAWSSGTGPYAIGGATSTLYQLALLGTFDPSATAGAAFSIGSTLALASGEDAYGLRVAPTFTEFSSGVHALLAAVHIAPTITAGVATVTTVAGLSVATFAAATGTTNAAGAYLVPPTGATNNYVFWATGAAARSRIDGELVFNASSIAPASLAQAAITRDNSSWFTFTAGDPTTGYRWYNAAGTTERMRLTDAGLLLVGDTANANMTVGLTLNQGANDDEILALKSSDVAHGMTTITETDTFVNMRKFGATDGGLRMDILAASGTVAWQTRAVSVTTDTTKTVGGVGIITLDAGIKSGTTIGAPGVDSNLLVIRANATAEFIFDTEGSAHANIEWVAFGAHDDLALLDALDRPFNDPIKGEFGAFLAEHRRILQREKVVNFYDDGPRAMVNMTRLAMLHTGALRQVAGRLRQVEDENRTLKAQMLTLSGGSR